MEEKRRWYDDHVKCYTKPIYHICWTSNAIIVRQITFGFLIAICILYTLLSLCLCLYRLRSWILPSVVAAMLRIFAQDDFHFCWRAAINLHFALILAVCAPVWNLLDSITRSMAMTIITIFYCVQRSLLINLYALLLMKSTENKQERSRDKCAQVFLMNTIQNHTQYTTINNMNISLFREFLF